MRALFLSLCLALPALPARAELLSLTPTPITEWKSVYGQVETRDRVPARARIGGTIEALDVTEGTAVTAGQPIALIRDTKLDFSINALDARLGALRARLTTAQADLERGQQLITRGVITQQRLDELQTQVNVINGEIAGTQAEKQTVERQIEEGRVLAPGDGIVLSVPVSRGSVLNPGEAVAEIGGGGVFLRLSVPERHASALAEGDMIEIETGAGTGQGRLAKLYPLISGGRVEADVEVDGLDSRFVGQRIAVRLPIGTRDALLVPASALHHQGGLDFVTVQMGDTRIERVIVPGAVISLDGSDWREILTGLTAGDVVVTDHD